MIYYNIIQYYILGANRLHAGSRRQESPWGKRHGKSIGQFQWKSTGKLPIPGKTANPLENCQFFGTFHRKVKFCWKMPLIIHWKMPVKIHDDVRGADLWCAIFYDATTTSTTKNNNNNTDSNNDNNNNDDNLLKMLLVVITTLPPEAFLAFVLPSRWNSPGNQYSMI